MSSSSSSPCIFVLFASFVCAAGRLCADHEHHAWYVSFLLPPQLPATVPFLVQDGASIQQKSPYPPTAVSKPASTSFLIECPRLSAVHSCHLEPGSSRALASMPAAALYARMARIDVDVTVCRHRCHPIAKCPNDQKQLQASIFSLCCFHIVKMFKAVVAVAVAAVEAHQLRSAAKPIRISCVGDSITAGVCSSTTHGYPAVLQTLLGSNYLVTNYGNSGKTMLKQGLCGPPAGGDCAYWDTPTYPQALESTPDIVTIMLGTNGWFRCR